VSALAVFLAKNPGTTDGGMSFRAHVIIAILTLVGLAFVVRMVRRHRLKSTYTMLWLSASVVLVVLVAFPTLLTHVSSAVGIYYPPATFLAIAVGVLFLIVVQFSWELSRLEERARVLAEESALLRSRIEEVERALEGSGPRTAETGQVDRST
jgi:hypothetical protein